MTVWAQNHQRIYKIDEVSNSSDALGVHFVHKWFNDPKWGSLSLKTLRWLSPSVPPWPLQLSELRLEGLQWVSDNFSGKVPLKMAWPGWSYNNLLTYYQFWAPSLLVLEASFFQEISTLGCTLEAPTCFTLGVLSLLHLASPSIEIKSSDNTLEQNNERAVCHCLPVARDPSLSSAYVVEQKGRHQCLYRFHPRASHVANTGPFLSTLSFNCQCSMRWPTMQKLWEWCPTSNRFCFCNSRK